MNSRRDWLKFFGVGAVIVPIIGAKADESMAARLIEPPKIKQVELFAAVPKPINLQYNVAGVTVLLALKDGTKRRLEIKYPQGWGTIEVDASRIELGFNTNDSPVSSFGSITGGFTL